MRNVTVSSVSRLPNPTADPCSEEGLQQIIDHWSERISLVLPDSPDLIVLPEQCDRPRVNDRPLPAAVRAEFPRVKGTRIRDALAEIAAAHSTYITYPSSRFDNGVHYNSLEIIGRDGETAAMYNKLVPTFYEFGAGVEAGDTALAAELDFGRVSAAICFDLNFEQVRSQVEATRPELILFPSAYHGGLMQNYWAYSCRSYFVSSVYPPNRSGIIDPVGDEIARMSNYDFVVTHTINLDYGVAHLDRNRDKLQRLKAAYGRGVMIKDPGLVGMVLISSQTEASAPELMAEFDIEPLDEYFAESTQHLR